MELEAFDEAVARPCRSLEEVSENIEKVLMNASFLTYENHVKEIARKYLRRVLPADDTGNYDVLEALKIVLASYQYGKTKQFTNNVYRIVIVLLLIDFYKYA